jgi:hypothetical protein
MLFVTNNLKSSFIFLSISRLNREYETFIDSFLKLLCLPFFEIHKLLTRIRERPKMPFNDFGINWKQA